jgi:hypothetical protein
MLERLRARFRKRRKPLSDSELAEGEALRRQAEEEVRRAETQAAEHRQRIDSHGKGSVGGWGGW